MKIITIKNILSKNSPAILTGLGMAGVILTTVSAVKATPKALILIENEKAETKLEIVKASWKVYVPTVILGGLTISSIFFANSINIKRNAALAGLYAMTQNTLKEYQTKVIETIGEKKEKKIREDIIESKIDNSKHNTSEIIMTGATDVLCYDVLSDRYFKNDMESLRRIQNDFNQQLISFMFVSLNELYYAMGLPGTKLGDDIGWTLDRGMIELKFSSHLTKKGEPCLAIDYVVEPRFGYDDFS